MTALFRLFRRGRHAAPRHVRPDANLAEFCAVLRVVRNMMPGGWL